MAVILFSHTAIAQQYTVSAYVKDNNTGEVLMGVSVIFDNRPGIGSTTNAYEVAVILSS